MFACTFYDLVVGVDLHFEIVPAVPSPVPFPHVFMGMVFDPFGLLVSLGLSNAIGLVMGGSLKGPVLINRLPAGNTGTEAVNYLVMPHVPLPPGVSWAPMMRAPAPPMRPGETPEPELPLPPPGDAILITGSKTVFTMGSNQCRLGDLAMSCSDPVRLPSSVVLAVPKGPPVMVGGPPAVDWQAAFMAFLRSKWVSNRLHKFIDNYLPSRFRNLAHRITCFFTGHPVDVATGRVMTWSIDFTLPGPLPLKFERLYSSAWADRPSPVGNGWDHSLAQSVWAEPGKVVYRAGDGRELEFDTFDFPHHRLSPGERVRDPVTRLTLSCLAEGRWEVIGPDGLTHSFVPLGPPHPRLPTLQAREKAALIRIQDPLGNAISLDYDAHGFLCRVLDSGGRELFFEHNARGQLVRVKLPHPSGEGFYTHLELSYSDEGDLRGTRDALGYRTQYEYVNHLLVKETDRTGLSFYFGYDGSGAEASCIRTWGDGGLYDHELRYDKQNHVTTVTDSLGRTTMYVAGPDNLVRQVMDAHGNSTTYEYDDCFRLLREKDALLREMTYAYDSLGNRSRVVLRDGSCLEAAYDIFSHLTRLKDANGNFWTWKYDTQGRLQESLTPTEEWTRYRHEGRRLVQLESSSGVRYHLSYNRTDELSGLRREQTTILRTESCTQTWYEYDALGRCIKEINPNGEVTQYGYDLAGRQTLLVLPDGRRYEQEYDGEGNLRQVRNSDRVETFTYAGFHQVATHVVGDGRVQLCYDTEGQLREVKNEKEESYSYSYDACGRVTEEVSFDGGRRTYFRDKAGRVIRSRGPGEAMSHYVYDGEDRLLRVEHSDGSFGEYGYGPDGHLIAARNESARVRLERDAMGRVIREVQGDVWVASRYGKGGALEQMESSLGWRQIVERTEAGEVVSVSASTPSSGKRHEWKTTWRRDCLGRELERVLPGGISSHWERDLVGRPVQRQVRRAKELDARQSYQWSGENRLEVVESETRGKGEREVASYHHDARGRLYAATLQTVGRLEESHQYLAPDEVGNVYRRADRSDRVYRAGGMVEEADGVQYLHDAEGNLVEKRLPDGSMWQYGWNGAGQLKEVKRPDGEVIRLEYDALGRRVRRVTGERTQEWVWDGDVLLHEVETGRALTSWMFEPERFTPIGKLEGDDWYGILGDHLGVPLALYDAHGNVAWEGRPDLYEAVTEETEGATACPWRFPGQYADTETGLYYNRFRYYDPGLGRYISRDPVGLAGGTHPFAYVPCPLSWIDPFGLLFGLYYFVEKGGVYVGSSIETVRRLGEHVSLKRLTSRSAATEVAIDVFGATGRDARRLLRLAEQELMNSMSASLSLTNAIRAVADKNIAFYTALRKWYQAGQKGKKPCR